MQSQQEFIDQQGPQPIEAHNHLIEGVNFESLDKEAKGTSLNLLSEKKILQGSTNSEDHKTSVDIKGKNDDLEGPEQVGGQDLYKSLVESDKLCSANAWKRVLREVQEVNAYFKSLKTYIGVVADTIGALHFLLYPGDGAMADKPLCGRILIPKNYPIVPPIVHLFTRTNRYNVDAYYSQTDPVNLQNMRSSMCFDILRSKNNGGIWEPEYTLSALISSLLQVIVSTKVAQEYGGEVTEFVSMEKLGSVHHNVETTYARYEHIMPSRKEIIHPQGVQIPTKYFDLPDKIMSLANAKDKVVESNRIYLQVSNDKAAGNVYSIGFDLSDLKTNPGTVFAIILSNAPDDPKGNKVGTILIRNGVTATAAKKRVGGQMNWFYHGKPMNQSDLKLIVTVGHNQFCISYLDGEHKLIHGDLPVSYLTPAEIGNASNQPFYLSVFLKNKGGPSITVKTFKPEYGYILSSAGSP